VECLARSRICGLIANLESSGGEHRASIIPPARLSARNTPRRPLAFACLLTDFAIRLEAEWRSARGRFSSNCNRPKISRHGVRRSRDQIRWAIRHAPKLLRVHEGTHAKPSRSINPLSPSKATQHLLTVHCFGRLNFARRPATRHRKFAGLVCGLPVPLGKRQRMPCRDRRSTRSEMQSGRYRVPPP
jgi:hypothetical protein